MSEARGEMLAALKEVIIPVLRDMGFSGSFPHFRRIRESQNDLLTLQFNRHGSSFVIEVSFCDPAGFTTSWEKFTPPNKVNAHDMNPYKRLRLGSPSPKEDGRWFSYESKSSEKYRNTALKVLQLLKSQAESYWQNPSCS